MSSRSVSTGSNSNGGKPRRSPYSIPGFEKYGKHCFSGRVADSYLKQHGSSAAILKDPSWVKDKADLVAAAVDAAEGPAAKKTEQTVTSSPHTERLFSEVEDADSLGDQPLIPKRLDSALLVVISESKQKNDDDDVVRCFISPQQFYDL